MRVAIYFQNWLAMQAGALRPRTVESYESLIRLYIVPSIGTKHMAMLRPSHIMQLLADICNSGKTRTAQAVYVLLKSALPADKTQGIPRPRHEQAVRAALSPAESAQYIAAALQDTQAMGLLLCLMAGLRRGEACGLRWQDVDMQTGVLHIRNQRIRLASGKIIDAPPKSHAGMRDVPIPPPLLPMLKAQRQLSGYVCPVTPSALDHAHRRVVIRAGVPAVPLHALRHTFATHALRAGGNMRVLQSILGHSSFATTAAIYTHPDTSMLKLVIDGASAVCYNSTMGRKST